MVKKLPQRLTFLQYMPPQASLQIFHGTLSTSTGLHWHEFYELSLILSGEGINYLNGREYSVSQGSIFLLTPADFHELKPQNGIQLEYFNVIFTDEEMDDELRQLLFGQNTAPIADCDPLLFHTMDAEFRRIWQEQRQASVCGLRLMRGALERILIELGRASCKTPSLLPSGSRLVRQSAIERALIYMQHHFREQLTLGIVATQANLAPNYFSECFRKTVGVSFKFYLQDLRIRFAKSLLKMTDLSITDLCFVAGFNNLSHFERVFKNKVGVTPSVYRQQIN